MTKRTSRKACCIVLVILLLCILLHFEIAYAQENPWLDFWQSSANHIYAFRESFGAHNDEK